MYKKVYENWISKQDEIEKKCKQMIKAKEAIDENVIKIKKYTDTQKQIMKNQLKKIGVKI